MTLAEMERIAAPLGRDPLDDVLELAQLEAAGWKPRLADIARSGEPVAGANTFYQDSRPPFATAIYPAVTLATTSKMLVRANPDTMVQPTEWWAGKKIFMFLFGQMTTAATPGNITVELRLGEADAGGTILATTTAVALGANKTNISWFMEFRVKCLSTGNGGVSASLIGYGSFQPNALSALIPAANNPMLVPETAPAAVTVDLTAGHGISVQVKRSGSTAETMQVIDQDFVHLN
jgi:hypothetical protein